MDQKIVIRDAREYRLLRKWVQEQGAPPAPNRRQRREYERLRAQVRRGGHGGMFALQVQTPVDGKVVHVFRRF